MILELSHNGVERLENSDGLTVYAFGKFENYENAEALKNEIVQLGLHSAHEIGVSNGEIVDVEEALEIIEE